MTKLVDRPAAGPWQPMETAPRDGTHVLIKFTDGLCHVCYWASWAADEDALYDNSQDGIEGGWTLEIDGIGVIMDNPVAWAKIL